MPNSKLNSELDHEYNDDDDCDMDGMHSIDSDWMNTITSTIIPQMNKENHNNAYNQYYTDDNAFIDL